MRNSEENNSNAARVFFALWPEATVRQALHTLATEYAPRCKARAIDADNLHMTLLFMGGVERTRLPQLMQAAGNISVPPFGFKFESLSFWPQSRIACTTLAADVPALGQLVAALKQQLTAADLVFENYEFIPHVTLLRNVENILAPQAIQPIDWWVESFVLAESVVTDQGSRYRILQEWPLPPISRG